MFTVLCKEKHSSNRGAIQSYRGVQKSVNCRNSTNIGSSALLRSGPSHGNGIPSSCLDEVLEAERSQVAAVHHGRTHVYVENHCRVPHLDLRRYRLRAVAVDHEPAVHRAHTRIVDVRVGHSVPRALGQHLHHEQRQLRLTRTSRAGP
jgi:hypothetical protein